MTNDQQEFDFSDSSVLSSHPSILTDSMSFSSNCYEVSQPKTALSLSIMETRSGRSRSGLGNGEGRWGGQGLWGSNYFYLH